MMASHQDPAGSDTRNRSARVLWIAVAMLQIWYLVGMLPVSVIEGDGATIAFGANQILVEGPQAVADAYRYDMQSGTYSAILWTSQLTGLDTFAAFSLLTAIAAVLFICLASRWVSRLCGLPWPLCWLLMFLFQEVWTSAYYPNSNTLAVCILFLALNVLTGADRTRTLVLGGILLGLGAWMRFDTVVIAPGVPLLLAPVRFRSVVAKTAVVALVAAIATLVATALSGTSIISIFHAFTGHREGFGSMYLTMRSYLAFFSLLSVGMILAGAWHLVRERNWRRLGLILAGTLPMPLLLGTTLTTPKYLLYLVPFFTLLAAYSVHFWLTQSATRRKILASIAALLFIVQYAGGIQLEYTRGYHPAPRPTLLTLGSLNVDTDSIERVSFVLGAGSTISTHDSIRMSSGQWFVGPMWRHFKQETDAIGDAVVEYVDSSPDEVLGVYVVEPWDSLQLVQHVLYRDGFQLQWDESYREGGHIVRTWTRGEQKVRVFSDDGEFDVEDFAKAQARIDTRQMLVYLLWNDEVHQIMRERFPNAPCVAGGPGAGHSAYVLTAEK